MTFNQFIAWFGLQLITWLPIAFCFYIACRLGIQHGIKYSVNALTRGQDTINRPKALTEEQRARIGDA